MATKQEIAREMLRIFDGKSERWCQGRMFLCDGRGRPYARCLIGASMEAADRLRCGGIGGEVDQAIAQKFGDPGAWNDAPERTFAEVQALLLSIAEES